MWFFVPLTSQKQEYNIIKGQLKLQFVPQKSSPDLAKIKTHSAKFKLSYGYVHRKIQESLRLKLGHIFKELLILFIVLYVG